MLDNKPHTPSPGPAAPVSIVILTWNGLEYTRKCLDTLFRNTDYPDYEVVVVDNGSTDGTIEYLQSLTSIRVVLNELNLGFAAGNNRALRTIGADRDVVLLNNDTEIHQTDWLANLYNSAHQAPNIGIVGCRLTRPNGMFQHAGSYMPVDTWWGQQIGAGEDDINQYNTDRDVESVVFACVYIPRRTLDAVGCLDEQYFSYFEDTDYCLRVLSAGYRVICCGSTTITHHENVSTSINSVCQNKMFLHAQGIFRSKWQDELLAERYTRSLAWHSLLNFPTGYAISSRELVCALDRAGVRVSYKYLYGPGSIFPKVEPELSDSYMVNVIRARKIENRDVQVVYGQGDMFQDNFGRYKIGFTMLETDGIPAEWVRQANLMDEVWVPSEFNKRTFRNSGVTKPIHVVPLGVDDNYFNPKIQGYSVPDVFSFLSVFEWGERKSPHLLLKAFNEEFRYDEPAMLICKVINVDPGVDVRAEIAALNLNPAGGRIHISLNEIVPNYQLGQLYRSVNAFVLPTRGEGWGMPIIEAMACGLPVIATDWSAHCDFLNKSNGYPLEVEGLVPAQAKCPYYQGFGWAEPSHRGLRRLMRHVFQNQAEARAVGARAAADVSAHWTWNSAAAHIIHRLDQIQVKSGRSRAAARRVGA